MCGLGIGDFLGGGRRSEKKNPEFCNNRSCLTLENRANKQSYKAAEQHPQAYK